MIFKRILQTLLLTSAVIWWQGALALDNPEMVVKETVTTLQKEITAQKASLQDSPKELYALVKKTVMPHLDINYMAGLTLRSLWRGADKEQRAQFVDEFGLLLTRAYANALLKVNDYDLRFSPVASGWEKKTFVAVSGAVVPKSGGQPSQVTYYLVNVNGQWKIYDMVVEGVSFLQNYRSQFAAYSEIAPLIAKLKEVNKKAS